MGLGFSCFGSGNEDHEPCPIVENLVNKFKSLFHRGQVEATASVNETETATTAPLTDDATESDSQENHHRVVIPLNKASLQTDNNTTTFHQNVVVVQESLKTQTNESKENKVCFPCSDDEDVCPTCLEEYDEENPKITTQCNHHYHLACIYEWMERSPSCPFCGKLMQFEQMN